MPKPKRTANPRSDLLRAEFVYSRLRDGIRNGEYRLGERLREVDLAERLNVSRTPIREAIHRLESEGLVEIAAGGRGMRVIDLSRQQIQELYAMRATLEGAVARYAAMHSSLSEMSTLDHLMSRMEDVKRSPSDLARFNQMFHSAICDAAHNQFMSQALVHLSYSLALLPGTTYSVPGRRESALREHREIVDAIKKRDSELAERVARNHIEQACTVRLQMLFEMGDHAPK
jgi:DNA-binding GntR family transcriptional regulator